MKDFFNKLLGVSLLTAPSTLSEVAELPTASRIPAQTTAEVIEEIHNAFRSVGDKLLADAQAVLAGTDKDSLAKGERLKAAGFVNTKQVKQTEAQRVAADAARKQQELIMQYAVKYPTSKFITRQHVDQIAAKYNLVVGDNSAYTGFVPDKNLREIEAFNKRFNDADKPISDISISRFSFEHSHKKQIEKLKSKNPTLTFAGDDAIFGDSLRYNSPYVLVDGEKVWFDHIERIDKGAQLIVAPIADMDMSQLKQHQGQWFKVNQVVYPDPVVLQPVKGGYLIVTAWGDEQYDELVFNGQNN